VGHAPVVKQGTATWLGKRLPAGLVVAGKTGTTNDMRDSWFAGFSGDKVVVAWVGRDDNKPTKRLHRRAAPLGRHHGGIEAQPLDDLPPDGVVASGACGRSVPYIAGYGGAACGGGGSTVAGPAQPTAEPSKSAAPPAPVVAQEDASDAARSPAPKPRPRQRANDQPKREHSPFLSDFYGD
jgi:penicillin-binding protein 1B